MATGLRRRIFGQTPIAILLLCTVAVSGVSLADSRPDTTGETLKHRYAGSYDTDRLLNEPAIRDSVQQLLGTELDHFLANLDVRGSVDLVAGSLALAGNSVHGGGSEEAILCVATHNKSVSAAVFSKGLITIFSNDPTYSAQTQCIKDWITQVNSGHRDRLKAPSNVQIAVHNESVP